MSQEYRFEFLGTKEAFLNNLDRFSHNSYSNSTFYYFDDYIVKQTDDEIHFGVARGGHSGGYWFIPTITEFDNRIEFCGTIRRVGGGNDPKDIKRVCNSIGEFMFMIRGFAIWQCYMERYCMITNLIHIIGNIGLIN